MQAVLLWCISPGWQGISVYWDIYWRQQDMETELHGTAN